MITQLSNDLRTLCDFVFVIEQNLKEDEVVEIPKPFQAQPVEKRTITSPMDEVSSNPTQSLIQTSVVVVAYPSLSLLFA